MKKWLEDPELNVWLSEVKGDTTTSANCKVCRTVFKLSTMGKSALKDYSDGKKQSEVKKIKTFFLPVNKPANKISSSVSFQSAQQSVDSFVYTSQTIVTEIIWALKTVSAGHSLRSNESIVDCFKKMFPDSKIKKNMSIGETKLMSLIKHGIAPYVNSLLELEADIKKSKCYMISFD